MRVCVCVFGRTVFVRLLSAAGTGYFYTFKRPRLAEKMVLRKYDPVGKKSPSPAPRSQRHEPNGCGAQCGNMCSSRRRSRSSNLRAAAWAVLASPWRLPIVPRARPGE